MGIKAWPRPQLHLKRHLSEFTSNSIYHWVTMKKNSIQTGGMLYFLAGWMNRQTDRWTVCNILSPYKAQLWHAILKSCQESLNDTAVSTKIKVSSVIYCVVVQTTERLICSIWWTFILNYFKILLTMQTNLQIDSVLYI